MRHHCRLWLGRPRLFWQRSSDAVWRSDADLAQTLHAATPAEKPWAQPTEQGFRELGKLGVRTVVSLRLFDSDRQLLGATRLA
jgi:hypothetical protein